MSRLLLPLLALNAVACKKAAPPAAPQKDVRLEFDREAVNFGSIEAGQTYTAKFMVTNRGTDPDILLCSDVYEWTNAVCATEPLAAGETVELALEVTPQRSFKTSMTVSVTGRTHVLLVEGTVVE